MFSPLSPPPPPPRLPTPSRPPFPPYRELQSLVERLEKEVAKRTAESAILEAGLNNERASQKVYKVKIKEMDVVVQQQAALIQELQSQLEHERSLQCSIAVCYFIYFLVLFVPPPSPLFIHTHPPYTHTHAQTKRNALIVQYKELQERVSDGDTRMVTD